MSEKNQHLAVHKKSFTDVQALNLPKEGMLIFDSEGKEGGFYQSRYPHVPNEDSGLTIGRGYDMKTKTKPEILQDLLHAGVDKEQAKKFIDAGHINVKGESAKEYIKEKELEDFSLTPIQQLKLFEISLAKETSEVKRICSKKDTVQKYGKVDFKKIHPAIKEVLVDLKFRGDYTTESRMLLQKHAADNNLEEFAKVIQDKNNWKKVPKDRFDNRSKYLEEQLKKNKTKTLLP